MEQNSYINYQNMVTTVTTGVSQLNNVCRHLSMEGQIENLNKIGNRLKNHVFSVGIMGEFKRGKSTVINALLGQNIVPADIVPCSATLNYIRWDADKRAEIHFKDGSSKNVSVDELSNYVTKITEESAENAENVEDAVVYYPCPFCQNGVQIIDTPGLNDDERMSEISSRVIPTLDAVIMVVTADSPFSQSEAEFVRNKVMTSDLGRIIFIVNKIDFIDEEDRPRLLASIKSKIESSVLKKMALVHGEDSEEYKNAKDKLGSIRLLPVSAKKALNGKMKNNPELIKESGYDEFEKALSQLLTEERGMLELIHPVNQLISVSREGLQTIDTRLNALAMSSEEFEKTQNETIAKIENTRNKKKAEISSLRSKSKSLYADLLPETSQLYENVENSLNEYIMELDINESNVSNKDAADEFAKNISVEINKEIENQLSIQFERLYVKIEERLGRDLEKMESVSREIAVDMNDIQLCMNKSSTGDAKGVIGGGIIEGVANMALVLGTDTLIPGIGGLISGFREHGLKGAVVGGLSGAGIGVAALLLLPEIGLVGLPLALVAGIVSSFGGKKITQLIFGKKAQTATISVEKIRDELLNAVSKSISELKRSQTIENWLYNTCETAYNSIADDIDCEWENMLQTFEGTLSQIKIDLQMNTENRKNAENMMNECKSSIMSVVDSIKPVQDKLTSALNKE